MELVKLSSNGYNGFTQPPPHPITAAYLLPNGTRAWTATSGSYPSPAECSAACGGTMELYRSNACLWDWARFLFVTFAGYAQAQLLWFGTDAPKFYVAWRVQQADGGAPVPRWMQLCARLLMLPRSSAKVQPVLQPAPLPTMR